MSEPTIYSNWSGRLTAPDRSASCMAVMMHETGLVFLLNLGASAPTWPAVQRRAAGLFPLTTEVQSKWLEIHVPSTTF